MSREIELGAKIWKLEQDIKLLGKTLDEKKDARKLYEAELMEHLTELDKNSTGHIKGVGEFAIKRKEYFHVNKSNMPTFCEYLKTHGEGGMVKESVETSTAKKYSEEWFEKIMIELAMQEDTCLDSFDYAFLHYPNARVALENLKKEEELLSNKQIANCILRAYGVTVFSETKLSHTKKGK